MSGETVEAAEKALWEEIGEGLDPIPATKVLTRAMELLDERGWCQGALGMARGEQVAAIQFMPGANITQVCTLGALMLAAVELTGVAYPAPRATLKAMAVEERAALMAVGVEERMMLASYHQAVDLAEVALNAAGYRTPFGVSVAHWNDQPSREKEQVLTLLRAAKALAAQKEEQA